MKNRVYGLSKKYIQFLYGTMLLASIVLPIALIGFSLKRDVTFEMSFLILLSVLGFVIFITLYHEGRKVIHTIENSQLELSDTRVLIIRNSKKEMVFFDELEEVSLYKNRWGHITQVIFTTVYGGETQIRHFDDIQEMVSIIKEKANVQVKSYYRDWFPIGAAGALTFGAALYYLI